MSDPLSLLRQATIAGRLPELLPAAEGTGNLYKIEGSRFADTERTAFRRTLKNNDYYYTVRDVVFFLANLNSNVGEYRRKAVEMRMAGVVETDRSDLTNYLKGTITSCPQIDAAVVAEYARNSNSNSSGSSSGVGSGQQLQSGGGSNSSSGATSATAAAATAVGMDVDEVPTISDEQMKQQREKIVAGLDFIVQKSRVAVTNENDDKVDELKQLKKAQKRKNLQAFSSSSEDDPAALKAFIEADRRALLKLRADDYPAQTRSSILNAPKQDFSFTLKLFHDKVLKYAKSEPATTATAAATAAARGHKSVTAAMAQKPATATAVASTHRSAANNNNNTAAVLPPSATKAPIIIVPSALTSLLTTLNIEDLLIKGIYSSAEEKKKQGARKERELLLVRQKAHANESTQFFKVLDDASRLQSEADWDRVVAVFVSGHSWQFKNWRISDPVNLFQRVLGVHVALDGQLVDPVIQSWNCKVLRMNQFKQHLNASTAKTFWMYLDDYIRVKKPHLINAAATAAKIAAKVSANGGNASSQTQQRQQQQLQQQQKKEVSSIPPLPPAMPMVPPPPPPLPPVAVTTTTAATAATTAATAVPLPPQPPMPPLPPEPTLPPLPPLPPLSS